MPTTDINTAIKDIKQGKMVIVVDDADRENEGDLVMAADKVTPEAFNFMVTYGRGLVCVPMEAQRLKTLQLPLMVQDNTSRLSTAFTISVDALSDTSTGISAKDRSKTIKTLVGENTKPEDLGKPGHIFPLKYADGGVLARAGHTEASVDLARLAGCYPAGVLCEVLSSNGEAAQLPELEEISKTHNIGIISVSDIISHRKKTEKLIQRVAEAKLPTEFGDFEAISYQSLVDKDEHVALVMGKISPEEPTLVRVHSECLTSDVFHSVRCDCGEQLSKALRAISNEGKGIFIYMRQEGRGIGIHNKLKAYHLQDGGLDTVEANVSLGFAPDIRHYGIGAQILEDLNVGKMKILTNNPRKVAGLKGFKNLEIVERIPLIAKTTESNKNYLKTKKEKLGHILE